VIRLDGSVTSEGGAFRHSRAGLST